MSLGAGALKVEGPIAQNGGIASEVTMATKRAPNPKTPPTQVLGGRRDRENGCHGTSETPNIPSTRNPSPKMKVNK